MKLTFLIAVFGGLVAGLAIVASRPGDSPARTEASPSTIGAHTPRETAEAFANAWAAADTERIRGLLDAASLARFPLDELESAYSSFDRELTIDERIVRVDSAEEAGATLHVQLLTAYFGTMEYTIVMPLVLEGDVYRVVWSEALLHPGLGAGDSFRSVIRRPVRGTIYDRHGTVLAETRDVRMVGLNRSVIDDPGAVSNVLRKFGFSEAQMAEAFASGLGQTQRVPVGRVPDDQVEAAIEAMETVSGIIIYFEEQRVHPLGAASAHVVGYTRELTAEELAAKAGQGVRVGDRVGAAGLEAGMEATLAGQIGAELRIVNRAGETLQILEDRRFREGGEVRSTLDSQVLATTYARMSGRPGAAVVLNPQTNEVLAMVSVPSFDPDAFERNDGAVLQSLVSDQGGPLIDRTTMGTYSAGSTFKLITGAAGLAAGVVGTSEQIFCGSVWTGLDPPRRNWEGSQGPQTVAEGLMRSCNPIFYEIGLRLYQQTDGQLSQMARKFGFGATTGQDLLPEAPGLVPDAAWKTATLGEPWYPGDEVNLAIGQGALLVTPLQLANAYSTFVTQLRREPVLVIPAGEASSPPVSLGLSGAQHDILERGLELVTGPYGTAAKAFWEAGYTDFAGKSGTAEDAGTQQHVLFVTFSPRNAPRALAAVVLEDGESGSLEAGPIARDAVLSALQSD